MQNFNFKDANVASLKLKFCISSWSVPKKKKKKKDANVTFEMNANLWLIRQMTLEINYGSQ